MATEMVKLKDSKDNTVVLLKIRNEDYDEDQGKKKPLPAGLINQYCKFVGI
jgi:hypothetical protein